MPAFSSVGPDDPRSRGYLCPKAYAMKEVYEDPDRLRAPIRKRYDGSWEEISWDEAFDYAADRLRAIRDTHGPNANGFYIGNPTGHNVGGQIYIPPLMGGLGTQRSFSAGTNGRSSLLEMLHRPRELCGGQTQLRRQGLRVPTGRPRAS